MQRALDVIRDPKWRVRAAWALFWLSVVGWPTSAVTWARHEPPTLLALSWLALIVSALNIVATTDVRREQENGS